MTAGVRTGETPARTRSEACTNTFRLPCTATARVAPPSTTWSLLSPASSTYKSQALGAPRATQLRSVTRLVAHFGAPGWAHCVVSGLPATSEHEVKTSRFCELSTICTRASPSLDSTIREPFQRLGSDLNIDVIVWSETNQD